MKRVRFRDPAGTVRTGTWLDDDGTVADDDGTVADDDGAPADDTTAGVGGRIAFGNRTYDPAEVDVLAPSEPSKIVCIGRNYAKHADELGSEVPDRPLLFLKPQNAVASHGSTVTLPAGKDRIDYEAELAVVIGEQARHVDAANAMGVVAGYTCLVDLSNRDDQNQEQNWVRGKAFDNAAPMGPVLASPEHVRGDVIATGTPEGVGPLSDGDEIAVDIEGVGQLRHTVSIPE
ncbi:2-hydroxyhepta-2,4-diene-1,7-dioate isomerase [Halobacteriales archaeon QH_6_66_25]|nr:MAG: 2-hydroxyhepta-2,4-diene-1,7-dioate isomerase [Halobacteriales archaeon QH_6_66_25]